MLELVKLIVDALVKAIPGVAGKRRTAKLADLGTRLFTVYTVCNEMLLRGERIVALLEELDTRGSVVDPSGTRILPQYWEVTGLIIEQGAELARVQVLIDEWAPHVQILSGTAYNRLVLSVGGKGDDIQWMMARKRGRRYGPAIRIDDADPAVSPTTASDVPPWDLIKDIRYLNHFNFRQEDILVDEDVVPEADTELAILRSYLTDRDPKAGLALIRDSLDQFRAALIENFKLEDILLRVTNRSTDLRLGEDDLQV
jgi:hypothetical protein